MTEASVTAESARITPPLVVSGVVKFHSTHKALAGLSFRVEAGEAVGLVGRNGAGKSTLFRILAGVSHFESGDVRIFGASPSEPSARARVGYLPEDGIAYPDMTGREYLVFRARMRGLSPHESRRDAELKAEQAGATMSWGRALGSLSKGELKRLTLASTMLGDPPLLLLDEPTAGLDPAQVLEVRKLIRQFAETRTVVVSTHILADVEAICSRTLLLDSGRLLFDGPLSSLPQGEALQSEVVRLLSERAS